jgi:hypothetical protein
MAEKPTPTPNLSPAVEKALRLKNQAIARFQAAQAKDRLRQRKADTRRKIILGGLVIKTHLEAFPEPVLIGAFLFLADHMKAEPNGAAWVKKFEARGNEVLAADAARKQTQEPAPPSDDAGA